MEVQVLSAAPSSISACQVRARQRGDDYRGCGGIGRRAGFRYLFPQGSGSSSLLSRTILNSTIASSDPPRLLLCYIAMRFGKIPLGFVLALLICDSANGQVANAKRHAQEASCSDELGDARAVCEQYCEALDCDGDPRAPRDDCQDLSLRFFNLVYRAPPCVSVSCPCPGFDEKRILTGGFELLNCETGRERTYLGLFNFDRLAFDEYEAGVAGIGGFDVQACRYFADDGTTELVTALSGAEVSECRRALLRVAQALEREGRSKASNSCPPP